MAESLADTATSDQARLVKTISLRQFRDSVADLTESVQVVKREGDTLSMLGTWTPATVGPMRFERAETGFNSRPFTPVPKTRGKS